MRDEQGVAGWELELGEGCSFIDATFRVDKATRRQAQAGTTKFDARKNRANDTEAE